MKVIVIGATGRVGQETVKALVERGHQVTAAGRSLEKIDESDNVTAVEYNLQEPVDHLATITEGHDAVIFTAGSGNTDLLNVDAFGVVKSAEAAKKVGISRYILLGAKWASFPKLWEEPDIKPAVEELQEYYIAKYFSTLYVRNDEGLNYTIVEPDELLEKSGTGKVEMNNRQPVGTPIPDVAEFLAESVDNDKTIHKIYTINTGETPIHQAIENL